jgi:hypothetical protein
MAAETTNSLNIEKDLAPIIGNEWCYANLDLDAGADNTVKDDIMLIRLKDTARAVSQLDLLTVKGSNKEIYEYRGRNIKGLVLGNSFELLFGPVFSAFKAPFFARIGDYAVFSQSQAPIIKCIDAYLDKQSLNVSANFKSGTKSLSPESNFLMYINPNRASGGVNYVRSGYADKYKRNMQAYKHFGSFAFQLTANGKEFNSRINLIATSGKEGNSELIWSLPLEADMQGKPHIVDDFESGHKDVIVQDKNNTLYLINATGTITWKKKLDEPVQGDIYAIDLFKNNTSEFLFATAHKLYLLDNAGKDAGSYPLNLAEATHTGLTAFDLNNDKEYTYMVCCDRGRIYGYYGNGKPLNGWVPMTVDATFPNPVKTFRYAGKNYFFGISSKGTIYLWNGAGTTAIKPVSLHAGIKEPVVVSPETRTFTCADTTGSVYNISFDGVIKKRTFPKFRHNPFFVYISKNEKGNQEYILSSEKIIAGYSGDSIERWKLLTTDKIEYRPEDIKSGGKDFIGYTSESAAKVYLFTPDGIPFSGFPRTGNTPFETGDINGTGDIDLVIGGPNRMVYRYRLSM